jgi:hypothetical protein
MLQAVVCTRCQCDVGAFGYLMRPPQRRVHLPCRTMALP